MINLLSFKIFQFDDKFAINRIQIKIINVSTTQMEHISLYYSISFFYFIRGKIK